MEESLLRELSPSETILDYETRACSLMDSRSVLFSSKFDFYENIDLVKKGVDEWKKLHHLQRVCIHTETSAVDGRIKRYFKYATKERLACNENLKFLKSCSGGDCWKILYENELYKGYDHENGLLWRLLFLKDEVKDGLHFYRVIFTVHHAIVDGKNHFCLIQQLLQVIEWLHMGRAITYETYKVMPSIEGFVLGTETSDVDDKEEEEEAVLVSYQIPDYLKPTDVARIKLIENGEIYTHSGQLYASLSSIIEENAKISFSKFISFEVEEAKLEKILKKCKENGLKLTGYISTLIKLAIANTYAHFSGNKDFQKTLRYFIAASARPYFNLDNYRMGNFATILYFENESSLPIEQASSFWTQAKAESDELHRKLDENNMADSLEEDKRFLKHVENGFLFDEFEKDYCLSNLGDMSKYCSTDNGLFTIHEHYVIMSSRKTSVYNLFFNGLATLHDRIFWTVTYPSYLIKNDAAEYLIENFKNLINKTIA